MWIRCALTSSIQARRVQSWLQLLKKQSISFGRSTQTLQLRLQSPSSRSEFQSSSLQTRLVPEHRSKPIACHFPGVACHLTCRRHTLKLPLCVCTHAVGCFRGCIRRGGVPQACLPLVAFLRASGRRLSLVYTSQGQKVDIRVAHHVVSRCVRHCCSSTAPARPH